MLGRSAGLAQHKRRIWLASDVLRSQLSCRIATSHSLASKASKQNRKRSVFRGLPPDWQAVIGIEIHAQLKSARKLFSSASPDTVADQGSQGEDDNALVSPFDAALPGALPRLQSEPVKLALKACLALECDIAKTSTFDRKHYFYPDLPNGYQITQKYHPLARNGSLRLLCDDGHLASKSDETVVSIEQVQLEQDTAKSTQFAGMDQSGVTIDLNRAGAALIEIVSGPDMRTAEQAGAYIRKVQEVLRKMEVCDGNMDQGSLRCDVNVSINRVGEPWGARCEVKNVNSTRFAMNAIESEIERQHHAITVEGLSIEQETRGYDEVTGRTTSLRSKEDAPDYRYMPDPNLPPLLVTTTLLQEIKEQMPETIEHQRQRLIKQYDVPLRDVNVLMRIGNGDGSSQVDSVQYFEEVAAGRNAKVCLNWITQDLLATLNRQEIPFSQMKLPASVLGQVIDLVQDKAVTVSTARDLLAEMTADSSGTVLRQHQSSDKPVLSLLRDRNQLSLGEDIDLTSLCQDVVTALPVEADKVRQGNAKVVSRLVGEAMKRVKGRADAQRIRQTLLDLLDKG